MKNQEIIQQGAEAIILKDKNEIIKYRISKKYRHQILDKKIIKSRTKSEAKILEKTSKIINTPVPISVSENQIKMPFIEGQKLSEHLESLNWKNICKIISNQIAKLHDNNIIHGDLTTSNMILIEKQIAEPKQTISEYPKVFFIDFGLGYISSRIEDKAVDLHLIKQALEAKHHSIYEQCWKIIEQNYNSKDKIKILEQLQKVELRGRYKRSC